MGAKLVAEIDLLSPDLLTCCERRRPFNVRPAPTTLGRHGEAAMTTEVPHGELYLGRNRDDEPTLYEAGNLTTHGVIVGMTGSGKTGLGMIMLEEALLSDVPTLIIDPKGDMGNLLLTFPDLAPADFAPWVDAEDDPAATAELWRSGLERSGIGPERIGALRSKCEMTIYTPGSSAGVPLNVIGSMAAPDPGDAADDAAFEESKHDEIEGLVSSLLGLVDIDSDPLSGREHILLANIVDHFWSRGLSVSIESLIESVMQPPFRKLGVMQLDTLFPEADRMKLAMKLNGLAASPAFAAWSQGVPLDIDAMLFQPNGDPRAAVVNIHHLSDQERQFVVTLLLSKVVTWMRSQPGSDDLRVLIYMDEVFGFVPPTAMPPSKKPILTILKQARAFGVGLVLSTQNPVDIDYKAISNAGTWMIGRLQTERDKARLLDGMERSDGGVDIKELDATISSLDKREFVLHSTRGGPQQFSTRWAMSYLAGPLTRTQIGELTQHRPAAVESSDASAGPGNSAPAAAERELADNESTVAPAVYSGIPVRYLRADAPWGDKVGLSPGGTRLVPALAVRMHLLYDETKADLRHEVEWEGVVRLDGVRIDPDDAVAIDFDDRDFTDSPAGDVVFVLPDATIDKSPLFTKAKADFKDHLYRNESLRLFHNPDLDAFSRVGEGEESFVHRCEDLADDRADEQVAKLREALVKKQDKLEADAAKLEDRIREIQYEVDSSRNNAIAGAAFDILGGLLGGGRRRRSGRSILAGRKATGKAQQRLATAENRYEEKMNDLYELQDEVEDDINQIVFEWQEKAGNVEAYDVPLEKTDIAVDDIAFLWIPT